MFKLRCPREQKVGHVINGYIHEAADARCIGQQWASLWVLKSFGGPILLRNVELGQVVIRWNSDRRWVVGLARNVMTVCVLLSL